VQDQLRDRLADDLQEPLHRGLQDILAGVVFQ
jgi:hypothetical protein